MRINDIKNTIYALITILAFVACNNLTTQLNMTNNENSIHENAQPKNTDTASSKRTKPIKHVEYIGTNEDHKWLLDIFASDISVVDAEYDSLEIQRYNRIKELTGTFDFQKPYPISSGLFMSLCPTYKNIKKEIMKNQYYNIDAHDWKVTLQKVKDFHESNRIQPIAKSSGYYNDDLTSQKKIWSKNDKISQEELTAVKFYTDYDTLQHELKKCFRLLNHCKNKEQEEELFQRMSSFFHWRFDIMGVVHKFSSDFNDIDGLERTKTTFLPILRHGIDCKMPINQKKFFQSMAGPLSTTTNVHVSRGFASTKGMNIQLVPRYPRLDKSYGVKAMPVYGLSDYPEEKEVLVSGGYFNIYHVLTKEDFTYKLPLAKMNFPIQSILKEIFLVLELFDSQIFSMSENLEKLLITLLTGLAGDFGVKMSDCSPLQKYLYKMVKNTIIKQDVNRIMLDKEEKEFEEKFKDIKDYVYSFFAILPKVFEDKQKKKKTVRIGHISNNIKYVFAKPKVILDINTSKPKTTFLISIDKIMRMYPNAEKLILENEYKLDDEVLRDFLKLLKFNKNCKIDQIKFLYYDFEGDDDIPTYNFYQDERVLKLTEIKELVKTIKYIKSIIHSLTNEINMLKSQDLAMEEEAIKLKEEAIKQKEEAIKLEEENLKLKDLCFKKEYLKIIDSKSYKTFLSPNSLNKDLISQLNGHGWDINHKKVISNKKYIGYEITLSKNNKK